MLLGPVLSEQGDSFLHRFVPIFMPWVYWHPEIAQLLILDVLQRYMWQQPKMLLKCGLVRFDKCEMVPQSCEHHVALSSLY